jgi:dephospho-CoA kinase
VVVSCVAEVQRERVLARQGMTEERFEQIMKLQVPDAEKREQADYVLDTGEALAETQIAVKRIVTQLTLMGIGLPAGEG